MVNKQHVMYARAISRAVKRVVGDVSVSFAGCEVVDADSGETRRLSGRESDARAEFDEMVRRNVEQAQG